MVRTQIQLHEEQVKRVKEIAQAKNTSMAEIIRRAVDMLLESQHEPSKKERWLRSLEVIGKFSSDRTDIAANHDDYLDEAYGSW